MSTEQGQRIPVPGSDDGHPQGGGSGAPQPQQQTGSAAEDALMNRVIERLASRGVLSGSAGTQSAAPGGVNYSH